MKIGTVLFLTVFTPVITLISFGYLLSDYGRIHSELQETANAYNTLARESEKRGAELNSCLITVQAQNLSIVQKETELGLLRSDNTRKATAIAALESNVTQLTDTNADLQSASISTGFDLNPWLVAVIIIAQVIVTLAGKRMAQKGEYVRLSPAERDLIVNLRRRKSL